MTSKRLFALVSAGLWFGLDWATKSWALATLAAGSQEITPFLNWSLAFNPGAAFSFLAAMGGWQRYFFLAIALVISAYLLYSIYREKLSWPLAIGYGGIIGGALGNAYDRLAHGHVIDFIDFHWGNAHYPTFNVADIGICLGVGLLLLTSLKPKPEKGHG